MATAETRQAFEQLLKQAERKNAGKKMVTKMENAIVENLERSLTKDDPLLESNTFNGEAEKSLKNLRNSELSKGKENKEGDYITADPKKPHRVKRKKVKIKHDKTATDQPDDSTEKMEQKPVKKPRSPKKTAKETQAMSGPADQTDESPRPMPTPRKLPAIKKPDEAAPDGEGSEEASRLVEKRKRRTKKRSTPRAQTSQEAVEEAIIPAQDEPAQEEVAVDAPIVEEPPPPPPQEPTTFEDDGTILGISVHHCDHLRADLRYVAHPVVRVSIVDSMTGKFIEKLDSSRHVSSFYESETISCILPLMTQPFDFKANRTILPRWEEMLVFNEPFKRLTFNSRDPSTPKPVLFFVIRDFVTMAKVNNRRDGGEKGWHNVAWAFLKLVNANGQPNAGRKMRLQLFYPPRGRAAAQGSIVEPAHDWWLNHPRQRYPATLYITVKAVIPPAELTRSSRSMIPTQPEEGALTFNEMNQSLERAESEAHLREEDDLAAMQQWSRLPGQTCKIPNAPFLRFWAGSEGSFTMQFSHRGTRLAAASSHEDTFPIIIYGIPSGEDIAVITGHQQLVYDLQWSKNDRYLLSASADGTAQVWDIDRHEKPTHTLPHPSYVYTASFHPVAQYLIASGGYDMTVRVWNIASVKSQLTQELIGHKAIINSIIFDQTGLNMYSGDGYGVIICWNCPAYEKAKKNVKTNWSIKMKIEDRDLAGVCINSLRLHPHNNKILIHCRDSTVRILDARIHSTKKFMGLINHRQLLRSSVTPCGTLIFSGSEDGCVYVWNIETGDQVAIYNELGYTSPVHAVVYHPHDHMVAFCSYATNQPILIYKFNSAVATMEAGFQGYGTVDGNIMQREEGIPSITAHIEASKAAVKLDRIKHQLDSVLADSLNLGGGNPALPPLPRNQDGQVITPIRSPRSRSQSPYKQQDGSFATLSTWGSTFDSTTQVGSRLAPSYLSPHASPEARAMAQQYARSGHAELGQSGTWRPNVAAVGGSPYRSQMSGVPPDVSFTVDKTGRQRLNVSSVPGAQQQCVVVALFDYQANRSDELTMVRGDVIRVFFKDSANWWFGERTSDKKQGYFPSNYVEEQVSTAAITQPDSQPPMFGVPGTATNKKVHALKMPGGRLQFYSQSESEGDDERLSNASLGSRQRRREAKTLTRRVQKVESPVVPKLRDLQSQSPETTFPKSILQKTSPRPKIVIEAPSTEATNIKEVSFADQKKTPKKADSKQKLSELIQAAIEGVETPSEAPKEEAREPVPTATPRRAGKSEPKAVTPPTKSRPKAKSSPQIPRSGHTETSFGGRPKGGSDSPRPASTPLNILKSVQALMSKNENESTFSQSVLGGHDIGTPRPHSEGGFQPPIHSTAMKKSRNPVENEDESITPGTSHGSVVRKARPLPKARKYTDEEAIPMVQMKGKKGRSSPGGLSNPAFDNDA